MSRQPHLTKPSRVAIRSKRAVTVLACILIFTGCQKGEDKQRANATAEYWGKLATTFSHCKLNSYTTKAKNAAEMAASFEPMLKALTRLKPNLSRCRCLHVDAEATAHGAEWIQSFGELQAFLVESSTFVDEAAEFNAISQSWITGSRGTRTHNGVTAPVFETGSSSGRMTSVFKLRGLESNQHQNVQSVPSYR